ncbi:hypothetical protein [Pseudanabaena sp. UWO310]|uniref:hypothetical protein n=1 Tax=Pseudanabaena sp. UWO310 TaxID=2480795 RepID=UPI00115811C0|nr:hypothetical protein [Pseudanabaena sp. UWO310]TYQ27128.1 hypothetical protein PseudUWO310_16305 [Pseudanabaena sp. UWO310]
MTLSKNKTHVLPMYNVSYLLLVETSIITQTDPHTWQSIAKLGECLLPEVVAVEIRNIASGKTEGNESAAKQFQKLLPKLNWKTTPLTSDRSDLAIRATQNLSRKAKLMMNVARSAAGVANAHPQQCVVLISDEISLRDRIAKLESKNLCAIPSAVARQWSRTDQEPPIVQLVIKQLQEQLEQTPVQSSHQPTNSPNETSKSAYLGVDRDTSPQSSPRTSSNFKGFNAINFIKFGLATTFLATILLFGWKLVQPQQFQQFWEKTGLPPLPKIFIQPNQPKKS